MEARFTAAAIGLLLAGNAAVSHAAVLTFEYDSIFSSGAVAPVGASPWLTATFDDGDTPGSVTLTMTLAGTVGDATVDEVYFNFDTGGFSLANLNFAYNAGSTGPDANGVLTGVDAYKADGDGFYDILVDMPPPPGNVKWGAGQTVVFDITSTDAITAGSFNFLSAPGTGSNSGPFLSAAHAQSTGPSGADSAWIAPSAVPVPAALWLFSSGLFGLVPLVRRRA